MTLKNILLSRETVIVLTLMLVTALSFAIGLGHSGLFDSKLYQASTLLALAFIKVRLVIRYFMEVKNAPWELQISCDAWLLSSCVALIAINAGWLT